MVDVLAATSPAEEAAVDAVREHHAALADALGVRVDALVSAASRRDALLGGVARLALLDWCYRDLLPHTRAEEESLYPVAHELEPGRLLVEALTAEHDLLARLVTDIDSARDVGPACDAATTLRAVFESHLQKDDDLLLPLLAAAPDVSLAGLVHGDPPG